ncbi:hypothetical protein GCM10027446_16620 [Angustibacter peucedani]
MGPCGPPHRSLTDDGCSGGGTDRTSVAVGDAVGVALGVGDAVAVVVERAAAPPSAVPEHAASSDTTTRVYVNRDIAG